MLQIVSSARFSASKICVVPCHYLRRQFHHSVKSQNEATNLYSQLLEDAKREAETPKRRTRVSKPRVKNTADAQELKEKNPKAAKKAKVPATRGTTRKVSSKQSKQDPDDHSNDSLGSAARHPSLNEIETGEKPCSSLNDPWQDIAGYLKTAYKTSSGDTRRAHVVSKSLCDDAIERLDPTLEQHVGCDILDINPGTCLWSKTLHDRLRPRKHILIEPDQKMYRPFINPLLDAPDSKYTLVPKSGIVWAHLQNILSEQHLPHQPRLLKNDPQLEEKNNTLLVIANIGFYPMKPYRGFESMASLVLYQFMSATRTKSLFQRYGRVRFMIWTNDEEKRHLLPREVHMRRKTAIEAEIAFEELNEVASTTEYAGAYQREREHDDAIGRGVLARMKASGMTTPPARQSLLMQKILGDDVEEQQENVWSVSSEKIKQILALEKQFESGELPKTVAKEGGGTKQSPEYKLYRRNITNLNFCRSRDRNLRELCNAHGRVAKLQKSVMERAEAGEDVTSLKQRVAKEKEEWLNDLGLLSDEHQLRVHYLLDNHRAANSKPPLLFYDRRPYEPILVQPEEFFPPHPMVLLDFHPAKTWPVLDDEHRDVLEYIVGTFFYLPTQSVERALKSLWPGAYEWIIEQCPSLTNIDKGGALSLDMLSVRMLSQEMLKEIITAWTTWPFRPSKHEVVSKMGGVGFDPESEKT